MDLKDLKKALDRVINGLGDQAQMSKIAKKATEQVHDRTKKGFGVDKHEGPKKRLKGLKDSYKTKRKKLKRQGRLADDTTPSKSNLTKSGAMLDNIKYEAKKGEATVYISGGKNKQKATYQANAGRTFMNLSKNEAKELVNIIEKEINDDIKKNGL